MQQPRHLRSDLRSGALPAAAPEPSLDLAAAPPADARRCRDAGAAAAQDPAPWAAFNARRGGALKMRHPLFWRSKHSPGSMEASLHYTFRIRTGLLCGSCEGHEAKSITIMVVTLLLL